MKTLLIINPYSRDGRSKEIAEKVVRHLHSKIFSFETEIITSFEQAYEISLRANKEGTDSIVAVGGDGTINKVLNGFYNQDGERISSSRFGVIHTGTSPDFCKSYGIPTNPIDAAETIIKGRTIEVPAGMIRLSPLEGSDDSMSVVKYFVCCANIGLGASLARAAGTGIRRYLGDFGGTFVSLLKILADYHGTEYLITEDEKASVISDALNISVGITPYIASGLKVYRDPEIKEDNFYVMKVAGINMKNLFPMLKKVYSGKRFVNTSYLNLSYSRVIKISKSERNNEVEFDGDPAGFLPCRIEIAKDKLTVFAA